MVEEYSIMSETGELPPKGKLRWNCRRGMKELEVLLLPFLEYCYDDFDSAFQRQFVRLLGFDDASLFSWFMGYIRITAKGTEIFEITKVKAQELVRNF